MRKFLTIGFLAVGMYSCQEEEAIRPVISEDSTEKETVWESQTKSTSYTAFPFLKRDSYMQYPGALITLESVMTQDFNYVFNYTYNEVDVVSSLEGADPASKTLIPSYASFADFENASLYLNPNPSVSVREDTVYHEQWVKPIYSMDHLYTALGGNAHILNAEVAGEIAYGKKDGKSRGMVYMEAIFYSYDLEIPAGSSLIEESADDGAFEEGTPVYVSKINMGRMAVVFFESASPYEEVEAALTTLIDGEGITEEQLELLENTKYIVSVSRGWNGLEIPVSIEGTNDFGHLERMLEAEGEDQVYGEGKYGAIISYELRHIDTNELAEVTFMAEYEVPKVVE
ncbi:thiol-activated cytolysin family protein [Echinicola strongylocentroti]|nr:thiol-activated cytolysin family protein [Echinicola strongylocentroti]